MRRSSKENLKTIREKLSLWDKASGLYILDNKNADVNGDGIVDNIYLIGRKPFDTESPFYEGITLIIQDGKTSYYTPVTLKVNIGYEPKLFIGDFTGDKIDDIFINISSGGSGGITYYYIYTFKDNDPIVIFDFEMFNEKYKYEVVYEDDYKVKITDKYLNQMYFIDLTCKGKEYLKEIYNDKGKLMKDISGWVLPLGGLFPVDVKDDGVLELLAIQRIAGRYNADGIGEVNTMLKYEKGEFKIFDRDLSIGGCDKE